MPAKRFPSELSSLYPRHRLQLSFAALNSIYGDMSARGNIVPDDVLRMIFEELEVPAPASGTHHLLGDSDTVLENRRTLGRAACVCKAFYGHAVRVLWRHLDDLVPLLHLLSSFAEVGTGGHPARSGTYMVCDDISSAEFDRLVSYASHVTTVGMRKLRTSPMRDILAATWVHIGRQAQGRPLLPNLRELYWRWSSTHCCGLLYIVSPSLTHLTIMVDPNDGSRWEREAAFKTLLAGVFTTAPGITRIEVEARSSPTIIPATIIARLRSVRRLAIGGQLVTDTDALRPLATLEGLRHLVLGLVQDVVPSFIGFNDLESLTLVQYPRDDLFFRVLASQRLVNLKIGFFVIRSTSSVSRTCEVWAHAFPSLRTISCTFGCLNIPTHSEPLASHIQPLFALPTISSLCLRLGNGQCTISNADIHDIAMAWPGLVTLELSNASSRAADSEGLGVASLLDLALRCPNLKKLRLPLLEISWRDLANSDGYPLLDHGLQDLKLPNCKVEFDQYSLGALLLDRLFPHLKLQLRQSPLTVEPTSGWERLEYNIWLCHRARRQQEQRGRSRGAEASAAVLAQVA
ncbi:hypothetical protein OH76DRAFT_638202 [Lentinus brumalis]|uniref:F-box domain-containing protein n=1 Tax=Lentinus brumalis TaxID=2498619 RepID=A0A371D8N6_9APHY|nr:hypothetical protein OH76DRAFT_638202 [Polyporus brumalis]